MNKHLTASEFEIHREVFASDVIRAETRKRELRKTLSICMAGSVLAIATLSFAYEGLISLRDAMTDHVHYVAFNNSPAGVPYPHLPLMPTSSVEASADIAATQARIEAAKAGLHRVLGRFQSEQDAFRKHLATGQLGTVLFPGQAQDSANIPFALPSADDFQP